MKSTILVIALLAAACHSTALNPESSQAKHSTETQFALDQILREIDAGRDPVGVMDSPPLSDEDAVAGLLAMGLKGTTDDPPLVIARDGFLFCSWNPLESPFWGQRGYAVRQQTGEVYAWSLW